MSEVEREERERVGGREWVSEQTSLPFSSWSKEDIS